MVFWAHGGMPPPRQARRAPVVAAGVPLFEVLMFLEDAVSGNVKEGEKRYESNP